MINWKQAARFYRGNAVASGRQRLRAHQALDDAGVPETTPHPSGKGLQYHPIRWRIARLAAERDAARAIVRRIARGGFMRVVDDAYAECVYCGEVVVVNLGHAADCVYVAAVELDR